MNGYKFRYQLAHSYSSVHVLEKDREARQWCEKEFGPENTDRWGFYIDGFNFNDEKDYTFFMLRWS